ncbi:acyl carrier protein [bacterium]|nr:acyl carrier protein [bacterium]
MDIRTDIKNFLKKQAPKGVTFSDSDSLLASGVIDSMKMLDLISFVEQQFNIKIDEDEMMPDNFESVDAITRFVEEKRQTSHA